MESIPAEVLGTITGTPVQKNAAQSDSCAVNLGSQQSPDCFFFFFLRTEEKQHLPCYTIWKKTKIKFKQRLVPTEMQPKNCEITKRLSFCGILYLFRKILCKKKMHFFLVNDSTYVWQCTFFSRVLALSLRFPDHFQMNVFFFVKPVNSDLTHSTIKKYLIQGMNHCYVYT